MMYDRAIVDAFGGPQTARPQRDVARLPTATLLDMAASLRKYSPDQERDDAGRFAGGGEFTEMPLPEGYGQPPSAAEQAANAPHEAAYIWSGGPQSDPVTGAEVKGMWAQDIRAALAGQVDNPEARAYGETLLKAANESPPTTADLYRGIGLSDRDYRKFNAISQGTIIPMNLSSWSPDDWTARGFASGQYGTVHDDALNREGIVSHQVIFDLAPGAHAFNATEDIWQGPQYGEHITAGLFRLDSVDHEDRSLPGTVLTMDTVHLTQVGVLQPGQLAGTKAATPSKPELLPWLERYQDTRMTPPSAPVRKYSEDQPRDEQGRWTDGGGGDAAAAEHLTADSAAVRDVADQLRESAAAAEPRATADMKAIAGRTGGNVDTHFIDPKGVERNTLAAVLKGDESTRSKLIDKMAEEKVGLQDAASKVYDNLRYTITYPAGTYADGALAAMQGMRDAGYEAVRGRNYWDEKSGYAGVNTVWKTSDGQIFEMQFHTPEALQFKEGEGHGLYEEMRALTPGSPERQAALDHIDRQWEVIRSDVPYLDHISQLMGSFFPPSA